MVSFVSANFKSFSQPNKEATELPAHTNNNWSEYTPRMLKKKPNRKLRPHLQQCQKFSAKEEYYKTKKELLERKSEREEREHELQIKLLNYEIKIKEIQYPQLKSTELHTE